MASPFILQSGTLANAIAVFTLPATGTITDNLGNVRPATTTQTVSMFLKAQPPTVTDFPGVEASSITVEGWAVAPMAVDSRVIPGTRGTITFGSLASSPCEVVSLNHQYGSTGFIGSLLKTTLGDALRIVIHLQQ